MKKYCTIIIALLCTCGAGAQKVKNIYFNLYTDSLKKGVYNYINVDAEYGNGKFLPLMTDEIELSSTAGEWQGNSLLLHKDSTYTDSVVVTARLRTMPEVIKCVTIYIKKSEDEGVLKTEVEMLKEWRRQKQ